MKDLDFYGFPKPSKEDWITKVSSDLKGKDFDEALVSDLWDKMSIDPMYFQKEKRSDQMTFHPKADIPGMTPRQWNNLVVIEVRNETSANTEILEELNSGADGVILKISGQPDLSKVLADVMLEYIQVYFLPLGDPAELQKSLRNFVGVHVDLTNKLHGGILWSPTSSLIKNGDGPLDFLFTSELISFYSEFQNFRPLSIDFANYAESGGNGLQELTFGLGEVIELIDGLSQYQVSASQVFSNLGFTISVGRDHFAEIAKLKAARNLISGLAALYDLNLQSDDIKLLVTTSTFTKSDIDTESNLIRQTYEAMAGILGGANAIWVKPSTTNEADALSKRMARNVSNILKDESHLDKVMDPAAGAYFLDQIQGEIEKQVKEDLTQIEEQGGWLSQYKRGQIQEEIRLERARIQQAVLNQDHVKVGANKYRTIEEGLGPKGFRLIEESALQLKPTRATYLLEKENFQK